MVKTWNCLIFVCICHHRFSWMKVRHNSDHLRSSITSPSWSQVTSKFCRKLTNYPITQTHWGALLVNNSWTELVCVVGLKAPTTTLLWSQHTMNITLILLSTDVDLEPQISSKCRGFTTFPSYLVASTSKCWPCDSIISGFHWFSLIFTDFTVVVQLPGQITVLTSSDLNPWVTNWLTPRGQVSILLAIIW